MPHDWVAFFAGMGLMLIGLAAGLVYLRIRR